MVGQRELVWIALFSVSLVSLGFQGCVHDLEDLFPGFCELRGSEGNVIQLKQENHVWEEMSVNCGGHSVPLPSFHTYESNRDRKSPTCDALKKRIKDTSISVLGGPAPEGGVQGFVDDRCNRGTAHTLLLYMSHQGFLPPAFAAELIMTDIQAGIVNAQSVEVQKSKALKELQERAAFGLAQGEIIYKANKEAFMTDIERQLSMAKMSIDNQKNTDLMGLESEMQATDSQLQQTLDQYRFQIEQEAAQFELMILQQKMSEEHQERAEKYGLNIPRGDALPQPMPMQHH